MRRGLYHLEDYFEALAAKRPLLIAGPLLFVSFVFAVLGDALASPQGIPTEVSSHR